MGQIDNPLPSTDTTGLYDGKTLVITSATSVQPNVLLRTGVFTPVGRTTDATEVKTLDLSADIGMRVTVRCSSNLYNEGENTSGAAQTLRVYTVNAVACNSTSACPDNTRAVQPGYIERRRQVQAVQ